MDNQELLYKIIQTVLEREEFTEDDYPGHYITYIPRCLYVSRGFFEYITKFEKLFSFFGIKLFVRIDMFDFEDSYIILSYDNYSPYWRLVIDKYRESAIV